MRGYPRLRSRACLLPVITNFEKGDLWQDLPGEWKVNCSSIWQLQRDCRCIKLLPINIRISKWIIFSGQATIAYELIEEQGFKDLDAILVPISGGGMTSGIALAAKVLNPKIKSQSWSFSHIFSNINDATYLLFSHCCGTGWQGIGKMLESQGEIMARSTAVLEHHRRGDQDSAGDSI